MIRAITARASTATLTAGSATTALTSSIVTPLSVSRPGNSAHRRRSNEGDAVSRGRGKRTLRLVKAAADILEEIQPATVRAVCYRLFVAGVIPNMEKSATNGVSRILTIAREEDEIPWKWIVDESREAETPLRWIDPDEAIEDTVRGFRRDNWQDQPCRVEVWSEKGTVRGTLGPVLDEFGVTFRVMHGYASATVVNDIAEISDTIEKQLVALYVGDWDPSGKHMSDIDLPRRLGEYGAELTLRRVALVKSDLRKLPSFTPESKQRDPRYRWFMRNVGTQCYELDAMSPPDLRRRVWAQILSHMDLPKWEHARLIERAEVQSMRDFHKSWQALINATAGPA